LHAIWPFDLIGSIDAWRHVGCFPSLSIASSLPKSELSIGYLLHDDPNPNDWLLFNVVVVNFVENNFSRLTTTISCVVCQINKNNNHFRHWLARSFGTKIAGIVVK